MNGRWLSHGCRKLPIDLYANCGTIVHRCRRRYFFGVCRISSRISPNLPEKVIWNNITLPRILCGKLSSNKFSVAGGYSWTVCFLSHSCFFAFESLIFWVRHIYTNVETSVPECSIFFGFRSNFQQTKNFWGALAPLAPTPQLPLYPKCGILQTMKCQRSIMSASTTRSNT